MLLIIEQLGMSLLHISHYWPLFVSQLNYAFYALMETYGFCPLWIVSVPHTIKKEQCLECDDDSSAQNV